METYDSGGLRGVRDPLDPALGGNTLDGDPWTHAPGVMDYLVHRFAVRSVLDLGCGQGHAAAYFHRVHHCAVVALDGLAANLERAVYPLVIHDLRTSPFVTSVDLVWCTETVEHIDAEFVDHVLDTLACGRVICMTHGEPGQAGYHHVNLKPPEYWIGHLQERGYFLAMDDTKRVREFGKQAGAVWLAKTGLVFIRT